jgi:hypothetical protein
MSVCVPVGAAAHQHLIEYGAELTPGKRVTIADVLTHVRGSVGCLFKFGEPLGQANERDMLATVRIYGGVPCFKLGRVTAPTGASRMLGRRLLQRTLWLHGASGICHAITSTACVAHSLAAVPCVPRFP